MRLAENETILSLRRRRGKVASRTAKGDGDRRDLAPALAHPGPSF